MEFSVRPVREDAAASIVGLLNPLIRAGKYTVMDEPVSVDEQIDFIRGFPERGVFNVAVGDAGQRLLGLQDVVPVSPGSGAFGHVGVISTFVSLGSHGRGIGRTLSEATFRAAKELGFVKISATIRADNPRAVSFYLRQGFRIVGTAQRHALIGGEYVDEVLAEKFLD
jgi:L-amino acid N-acyltransferase YncA